MLCEEKSHPDSEIHEFNFFYHLSEQERKLPSGQDAIRGSEVTFTPATRHHSGIYYCEASNGFSEEPARAVVKLDVQRKSSAEKQHFILFVFGVILVVIFRYYL